MSRRGLRVAAAALAVILGVWAGARLHSKGVHSGAGLAIPVGEASPPTASDFIDDPHEGLMPAATRVPARLPDFALENLDGRLTPITQWAGKSLVINFWATWCAPCRREIPMLETLSGEWADRGVEVIGIAVDRREGVVNYAKALNIPYPLLIGEQDALDVAGALGVPSPVFPFTVFTDSQGQVVALFVGELKKSQADLILSVVQDVNGRKVALPEARRSITEGLNSLSGGAKPG
jgi:thiol-disulfide isomerase/thioredoxin